MRRAVLLVFASCAQLDSAESTTGAPLVGVDGSADQADRNCHVVLRGLERTSTGGPAFETNGSSWVWSGVIEVSQAAAAEGLTPSVVYHYGSDPAWREIAATPLAGGATPGFQRFAIRLDEGLVGPGMSATAITSARIDVVPFLHLPQGGRLFDHNRHASDFENYVMTYPDLAIGSDASVCGAPSSSQHANLIFAADFTQRREGVLSAGGTMAITYDAARLTTCRNSQGAHKLWDMTAHVRFEPTGQQLAASVRDGAATFTVPTNGALSVAVWFENTSTSGCQAWDSNFGANYRFDIARAPQWIGNAQTRLTRDTSDPCDGGIAATSGFSFDTWVRQRAAITNLCFEVYQPGLTDRDDPDLWQKLDAAVRYRIVGETEWHVMSAQLAGRRGNNARYATSWRAADPFRPYQCPAVQPTATPDGMYRQLAVEYIVVVNGGELRPAPGAAFSGTFIDYPSTSCP